MWPVIAIRYLAPLIHLSSDCRSFKDSAFHELKGYQNLEALRTAAKSKAEDLLNESTPTTDDITEDLEDLTGAPVILAILQKDSDQVRKELEDGADWVSSAK